MASGLLVYPFGFNSATVKRFCENSDIYYAGDCQIGWGYMLAIVGAILKKEIPFSFSLTTCDSASFLSLGREEKVLLSSLFFTDWGR
uniref:Uncharacterized protein n=1 Tax=Coturnix japonica TaxID=93934 RepID=A0A8C2TXJ6_COTJA